MLFRKGFLHVLIRRTFHCLLSLGAFHVRSVTVDSSFRFFAGVFSVRSFAGAFSFRSFALTFYMGCLAGTISVRSFAEAFPLRSFLKASQCTLSMGQSRALFCVDCSSAFFLRGFFHALFREEFFFVPSHWDYFGANFRRGTSPSAPNKIVYCGYTTKSRYRSIYSSIRQKTRSLVCFCHSSARSFSSQTASH